MSVARSHARSIGLPVNLATSPTDQSYRFIGSG
jgi:hypothetical protein